MVVNVHQCSMVFIRATKAAAALANFRNSAALRAAVRMSKEAHAEVSVFPEYRSVSKESVSKRAPILGVAIYNRGVIQRIALPERPYYTNLRLNE